MKIKVKALSVNDCYTHTITNSRGKLTVMRVSTGDLKKFKRDVGVQLRSLKLPCYPLAVYYEFGLSSHGFDYDNGIKAFQDIISKHYDFNDNQIYESHIYKKIVKKGEEYMTFHFSKASKEQSMIDRVLEILDDGTGAELQRARVKDILTNLRGER